LNLYERIPSTAVVITVGGESFALTDHLSKTVKAAVPRALEAVRCALLGNDAATSLPHAS
jgi:Ni,Fe-hydrogenase maturation factor